MSYLRDKLLAENTMVSYYIYENVFTKYFNKHRKEVEYKRTVRVDKREPLLDGISKLQKLTVPYLPHQFSVCCDTVYWKEFLSQTSHYELWLGYSQNLALKEKRQVQSALFSGKHQTLHNTVLYKPNNQGHKFIYHLSDDTNHDHIFTFSAIYDIISNHPEIIEDKYLILQSDNCHDQYKCKYMFHQELARKFIITVAWFYGEAGHGKGLVDAMSSLGCKQPITNAVITEDKWLKKNFYQGQYGLIHIAHSVNFDQSLSNHI